MSHLRKNNWPGIRHIAIAAGLMILGVVNDASGGADGSLPAITNLLQLNQTVNSGQAFVRSLNLEVTVWWSSEAEGRVIVHDDSGAAQLELDLPCPMPHQGDRVSLTGNCLAVKTRDVIRLSGVPVVDNDGLHVATEQSGSIYLKAGWQPIRVAWFNRTDKYALEVDYAGPDLPRQRIPDSALFRATLDPVNGTTNFVNGLDYRCCEGLWWSRLPNLDHLDTVKTGVVGNFDLSVKTREEHVGFQFSSYLQIAREGVYTFYAKSDDGSRLFIGDSSLHVNVFGKTTLPSPSRVADDSTVLEPGGYEWSEIEGTVTFVNRLADVLEIELVTGSGRVRMKVAENSRCSYALVPKNRIRAVGVCHTIRSLNGTKVPGEFFVQNWSDIEQRYVTPDLWATYPLMTIGNALAAGFPGNLQPVVHLRGNIIPPVAGQPAFLEDASGKIALETSGSNYPAGETSELLGRLDAGGTNRVLRCEYFRRVGEPSDRLGTLPILTTAEQVNQLNPEELKRGYPVKLRGVVTTVLQGDAVVIQDSTRGIYVAIGKPIPLQVGDYCEVEGTTQPGEFSPYIAASEISCTGTSLLPNPVIPTWDQLLNGSLHAQYVELEGVATLIESNTVTLLTRDGRIRVQLDSMASPIPQSYLNAVIHMRGCLFASWDQQAQRVKVGDIRINQQWVNLVQPAPLDPFAIPAKHAGELLRFDPQAGAFQRVKVSGQIIFQGDGGCFLMDGDNGLRFIYPGKPTAHVCDLAEVVGFLDVSGPSPLLREAVVQRTGLAELPKPRQLKSDNLLSDEFDSALVQIEGVLLTENSTTSGYVLEMQNGLRRFIAVINDKTGLAPNLIPGSRLELTGVYVGQGGNHVLGQPIDSFRLLLNTGFDVRVLSRPPWWTLRRMLTVVGVLIGVLIAALIWIKQLRTKVDQRTLQLEAQIQRRQQVEHQRAVEQERIRVAQDLHDDLGAGLTRVNMLTTLAANPATTGEEKAHYLTDLNAMARDMVTSLDEIVWAINPRNDTLASLVGYFCAHAQRLLALASVKCGLEVTEELPDIQLDSKFRHELLMAFKETITNVIRHAAATKVCLRIAVQHGVLVMEVEDDGRGLVDCRKQAGADGLANMKDRLNALGGRCDIRANPSGGITVRFEAPLTPVTK